VGLGLVEDLMHLIRTLPAGASVLAVGTMAALSAPAASSASTPPPLVMYLKSGFKDAKMKPLTIPFLKDGKTYDIDVPPGGWETWKAFNSGATDQAFAPAAAIGGQAITYLLGTNMQPHGGDTYVHCMTYAESGTTRYLVYTSTNGWKYASLKTYDACASEPFGG
jgi:hypothetical protein